MTVILKCPRCSRPEKRYYGKIIEANFDRMTGVSYRGCLNCGWEEAPDVDDMPENTHRIRLPQGPHDTGVTP